MFEAPPNTGSTKSNCEVAHRKIDQHEEHRNLFQRIFDRHKDKTMDAESSLHADGAVRKMTVPKGWEEMMPRMSRPDAVIGPLQLNEFHAPDHEDVRLCYWNRAYGNRREDPDTAKAFQNILHAEPHKLNGEELNSIRHLIGDGMYGNPDRFNVLNAETKNIHGRNVLTVEAVYTASDSERPNKRSYSMYISSDNTGRYTEQLYYVAPESEYSRHAPQAVESMNSIRWHRQAKLPF